MARSVGARGPERKSKGDRGLQKGEVERASVDDAEAEPKLLELHGGVIETSGGAVAIKTTDDTNDDNGLDEDQPKGRPTDLSFRMASRRWPRLYCLQSTAPIASLPSVVSRRQVSARPTEASESAVWCAAEATDSTEGRWMCLEVDPACRAVGYPYTSVPSASTRSSNDRYETP